MGPSPTKTRLLSGLGAFALLVGGHVATASAQQGQPEARPDDNEIIVTADRRAQPVEEVPYNISAISGETLDNNNVNDFSKLTRSFAGLQLTDRGIRDNATTARLVSRGINAESSIAPEIPFLTVSPVATYVDDTPVFVNLRMHDIDRVEFLRGPQGTLYGSGSIGGTLRYIHNQPDVSDVAYNVETGVSLTEDADELNYTANAMFNAPLGDRAALRVSGGYDSYAGYIDATRRAILGPDGIALPADPLDPLGSPPATEPRDNINAADVAYFRGALRVLPTDHVSVQLSYDYQEENADNRDAQSTTPGAPARTVDSLLDEPFSRTLDLVSLDAEFEFGFATLTSNTSYYETDMRANFDQTGLYETLGYLLIPRMTFPSTIDQNRSAITQELRLVSTTGGNFDWLVGVYYQDEDATDIDEHDYFRGDSLLGFSVTGPDELFLQLSRETSFQDAALFGEVTFHINDNWRITGGARAFRQEFSSFSFIDFPAFGFYPGDPLSSEDEGVLFKANVAGDLSENAMVYATFSQGFRRGGANSIPTSGPLAEPIELTSYDPDRVNNYELGLKGLLAGGLRYSTAIYFVDWSDAQVGTLSPVFGFDVAVNAGDATSRGAELELSGQLTDQLSFDLGYAYTDAHLEEGFTGFVSGQPGARLPGVSKHTFTGALDYVIPVATNTDLTLHADGSYRSDFVNSVDNTAPVYREFDGFAIFDLSASLDHGPWRLSAYVENVADEEGISAQGDPGLFTQPYVFEWGVRPRTIGLTLSLRR